MAYHITYPDWLGPNPFVESAMKGYLGQVKIAADSGTFIVDFHAIEGFAREVGQDVALYGWAAASNAVFVDIVGRDQVLAAIEALASQGFEPLKPQPTNSTR